MDLKGKRVLITHPLISEIMGSTVVCVQVAEALQHLGADVLVLSSSFTGPARAMFESRGVPVVIDEKQHYSIYDYDYVWIHSQLLPMSFVDQLQQINEYGIPSGKKPAAFIYNHMSAVDYAPGEQPYIMSLEESTASLEVFVSEECKEKLQPFYQKSLNHAVPQRIFANPAPSAFNTIAPIPTAIDTPQRIAIISNHVPDELLEARRLLEEQGITTDIIGKQGTVEEVTPAVLERYNAIITIGKTVQYCLCAGKPVYIYDQFGGFGYLNSDNFQICSALNFSGRGGQRFTAEYIANDVVNSYKDAVEYYQTHRNQWQKDYSIEEALIDLLAKVQPRSEIQFPFEGYYLTLASQMRFAWRFYRYWDYEIWVNHRKDELEATQASLEEELVSAGKHAHELEQEVKQQQSRISELDRLVQRVYDSTSYRMGHAIVKPIHALVNKFATIRR